MNEVMQMGSSALGAVPRVPSATFEPLVDPHGAAYGADQFAARGGAGDERSRAAGDEVRNLRRGFLRLGIGLAALWFVFWTCAYVINPYTSLKPEPAFAIRVTAWSVLAPCLLASVVFGGWIAAGSGQNMTLPKIGARAPTWPISNRNHG